MRRRGSASAYCWTVVSAVLISLHSCGGDAPSPDVTPPVPEAGEIGRLVAALVRQRYEQDCGIAALATLLRVVGLDVTYDAVAAGITLSERGVSMATLAGVAARFGRPLDGYRLGSLDHLFIAPPWIALINSAYSGHYVVVAASWADSLLVLDPRAGIRRMSARTFDSVWSGYALVLRDDQSASSQPLLRRIAHFMSPTIE